MYYYDVADSFSLHMCVQNRALVYSQPCAIWSSVLPIQSNLHVANSVAVALSQDNAVSIATRLRDGRSGFRISLWIRDFFLAQKVQTSPGAHTASCLMGTGVLSPEVQRQGLELTTRFLLVQG